MEGNSTFHPVLSVCHFWKADRSNLHLAHMMLSFPEVPEDVIQRRLLIDGDGTGDDRRLNLLQKSFIKWASSEVSPSER